MKARTKRIFMVVLACVMMVSLMAFSASANLTWSLNPSRNIAAQTDEYKISIENTTIYSDMNITVPAANAPTGTWIYAHVFADAAMTDYIGEVTLTVSGGSYTGAAQGFENIGSIHGAIYLKLVPSEASIRLYKPTSIGYPFTYADVALTIVASGTAIG